MERRVGINFDQDVVDSVDNICKKIGMYYVHSITIGTLQYTSQSLVGDEWRTVFNAIISNKNITHIYLYLFLFSLICVYLVFI